MPTIALGSDHAGFQVKQRIIEHLRQNYPQLEITDCGPQSEESVDYPDLAHQVAGKVCSGEAHQGVLVCGSGIGMSIAANRHPGIRAALCHDAFTARMSRLHNDANVLVVGGRVSGLEVILDILEIFLNTDFEGDRHIRRVKKIELPENRGE